MWKIAQRVDSKVVVLSVHTFVVPIMMEND